MELCTHDVYIKGLCGNCGIRLDEPQRSSLSMVHSIPELKVSEGYARKIGEGEQNRLIDEKKLILLVDLDQTILHTTHEAIKDKSPEIYSFCLWPGHPTYHTKLRRDLDTFLDSMSKIYEMHIFTFACKRYAHKISSIIDPEQKYFGNRILSRDESRDQFCKHGNLDNIFPCGDAMIVIIDDRADVWANSPNLVRVKPYVYFKTSICDGGPMQAEEAELEAQFKALDEYINGSDDDDDEDEADKQVDESDRQADEICMEVNKSPEIDEKGDYLLNLAIVLENIHERWFKELDEKRQFLAHGERYKLPETKDIIRFIKSTRSWKILDEIEL